MKLSNIVPLCAAAAVITAMLAGCVSVEHKTSSIDTEPKNTNADTMPQTDDMEKLSYDVGLQIDNPVINTTTTTLDTYWQNNSKSDVYYGEYYKIQREENGTWVDCEQVPPGFSFILTANVLKSGENRYKSYGLYGSYDVSTPGKYRICTDYTPFKWSATRTNIDIFAEFTVVED